MIYVIQAGDGGPCKVGYAKNPQRRVAILQCASPVHLNILHVWDGEREMEARLHQHLSAHRISGEWFEPVPNLLSGQVVHDISPAQPRRRGDGSPAARPIGELLAMVRADLLTPSDVEALAAVAGKPMAAVFKDAGIAPSTFNRWRAGKTEPTLDVYRRLQRAVAPAEPAQ